MAEHTHTETTPTLVFNPKTKTLHLSPQPTPTAQTPTSLLIRVHSTSLTRGELSWPEPNSISTAIPGRDFAGTVLWAGEGSAFAAGARVYGLTTFGAAGHARGVSVAEQVAVAAMPAGLGFEQAAAVPMGGLSAWQALFTQAALESRGAATERNRGLRVLVTGAGGGVGLWAVQFARWAGCRTVVGVVGRSGQDLVKGLGPDAVVGAEDEWGHEEEGGFDVVVDCAGGKVLEKAWTMVSKGGVVVSVAEPPEGRRPTEGVAEGARGVWFIVEPDGKMLGEITELIEEGLVRPVVDSVWPLEEWEKALDKAENGRPRGKVVLKVQD